jgi:trehalose utilization protein
MKRIIIIVILPAILNVGQAIAQASVVKAQEKTIEVVIWDEQQPKQKDVYPNFLGNHIADYLAKQSQLSVSSVNINSPQQGLSKEVLDNCDVLIWWGHIRQFEITPEKGEQVVKRIKSGQLSLITLHSAHWSTPFVEAMDERTRMNAEKLFASKETQKVEYTYVPPTERYTTPEKDSLLTPSYYPRKFPDGKTTVKVHLPLCCFPGNRADGKPSYINILKPDHPIVKDIPRRFTVEQTEMYDEPFHVPEPDEVIFEERWPTGEWFRSGSVWNIGKGKVFYFRPGHETYNVFHNPLVLKIIENAVRWLGEEQK